MKIAPIILEGADHLGKTTAARILEHRFGLVYDHMSKPDIGFDFIYDFLPKLRPNTVWDRFHLGGFVYGHVLDLHPWPISEDRFAEFVSLLRSLCVTVVFYAEDECWFKQHLFVNGKEEMFTLHDILRANRVYKSMASVWGRFAIDISGNRFPSARDVSDWVELAKEVYENGARHSRR